MTEGEREVNKELSMSLEAHLFCVGTGVWSSCVHCCCDCCGFVADALGWCLGGFGEACYEIVTCSCSD